jgi:post-segregation antitoxin (ccd killing protein)
MPSASREAAKLSLDNEFLSQARELDIKMLR